MKILVSEKLSEHKFKTPEGYLICTDAILARTGPQIYRRREVFGDSCEDADIEIEIDRRPEEVFSEKTLASFENKPLCIEHPDEDVNVENHNMYSVGYARDIHKGIYEGKPVMLGTLVITNKEAIEDVESGKLTDLSCGYDCDIVDEENPQQRNIRGNHIALCEQGRAGIAHIVDSVVKDESQYVVYADGTWNNYRALFAKHIGTPKYSTERDADFFNEEEAKQKILAKGKYEWVMKKVRDMKDTSAAYNGFSYMINLYKTRRDQLESITAKIKAANDLTEDEKKKLIVQANSYMKDSVEDFDIEAVKRKNKAVAWLKEKGLYEEFIEKELYKKYSDYEYAVMKGMKDSIKDEKVMKFANNKLGKQFLIVENEDGTAMVRNSAGQTRQFESCKKAEEVLRSKGFTIFDEFDEDLIEDDLAQSGSEEAFKKNIETEIKADKDPKQAVAIAYATKRANDSFEQDVKYAIDHFKNGIKIDNHSDFDVVRKIAEKKNVGVEYNDRTKYVKFIYDSVKTFEVKYKDQLFKVKANSFKDACKKVRESLK